MPSRRAGSRSRKPARNSSRHSAAPCSRKPALPPAAAPAPPSTAPSPPGTAPAPPGTTPSPPGSAPPVTTAPAPIRIGPVHAPDWTPAAAPGATNDDSVRHRSGPQPELVGAWGGHGPGLFRRGSNSENDRDCGSGSNRLTHGFSSSIKGKSIGASGYAPILTHSVPIRRDRLAAD